MSSTVSEFADNDDGSYSQYQNLSTNTSLDETYTDSSSSVTVVESDTDFSSEIGDQETGLYTTSENASATNNVSESGTTGAVSFTLTQTDSNSFATTGSGDYARESRVGQTAVSSASMGPRSENRGYEA
jgi:hypothetical protein